MVKRNPRVCATWIRKFTELRIKRQLLVFLLVIYLLTTASVKHNGGIKPAPFDNSIAWLNELRLGTTMYYLRKGDTLYRLSKLYFVSLAELLLVNHIENPKRLAEHAKIYIPPVNYAADNIQEYYLAPGDTRQRLLEKYQLQPWQFQRLNPAFQSGQIILIGASTRTKVFLPRYPLAGNRRSGYSHYRITRLHIIRPVHGVLSSRYGFRWGRMHYGVDLAAPAGTQVQAAANGRVVVAGWRGGYGLLVIINHGTFRTFYGHLAVVLVKSGQTVSQGTPVGLVGSTGHAYGSHLHFEMERNGRKLNPLPYFSYPGN